MLNKIKCWLGFHDYKNVCDTVYWRWRFGLTTAVPQPKLKTMEDCEIHVCHRCLTIDSFDAIQRLGI